jgi:hypothetical protein
MRPAGISAHAPCAHPEQFGLPRPDKLYRQSAVGHGPVIPNLNSNRVAMQVFGQTRNSIKKRCAFRK